MRASRFALRLILQAQQRLNTLLERRCRGPRLLIFCHCDGEQKDKAECGRQKGRYDYQGSPCSFAGP
jgi:hypothetical protein